MSEDVIALVGNWSEYGSLGGYRICFDGDMLDSEGEEVKREVVLAAAKESHLHLARFIAWLEAIPKLPQMNGPKLTSSEAA